MQKYNKESFLINYDFLEKSGNLPKFEDDLVDTHFGKEKTKVLKNELKWLKENQLIKDKINFPEIFYALLIKDLLIYGIKEENLKVIIQNLVSNNKLLFSYYYLITKNTSQFIYLVVFKDLSIDFFEVSELTNYINSDIIKESDITIKLSFQNYVNILYGKDLSNIDKRIAGKSKQIKKVYEIINYLKLNDFQIIEIEENTLLLKGNRSTINIEKWKEWTEEKFFNFGEIGFKIRGGKKVGIYQNFLVKIDINGKHILSYK